MVNSENESIKKGKILYRPDITKTIELIPKGETRLYEAAQFISVSSIYNAIANIKRKSKKEYSLHMIDNGVRYTITRTK